MNFSANAMASGQPSGTSQRAKWAKGQPIGELMQQALAYPELISLAAGFVDSATLPVEAVSELIRQWSQDPEVLRSALQYGSNQGDPRLRAEVVRFGYRQHGTAHPIDPDQVLLTAGSNQFLHLFAEAQFNPGDIVLTAVPTYFVFLGTLKNLGVRSISVPSDQWGMQPEALRATLADLESQGLARQVKSVYLIPYFDNPGSTTLTLERRIAIADTISEWRSAHGPQCTLLADYAYQELSFTGQSLPPWRSLNASYDDFTVEAGTFSKSFSPGIRVGWGVVPHDLVEPLTAIKANMDFGSPNFSQQMMRCILQSGELEAHLPKIRAGYALKCQSMIDACDEYLSGVDGVHWHQPQGGLYVWLELPPSMDVGPGSEIYRRAIQQGVLYVPGQYCFPEEGVPVRRHSMRLTFGVQTPDRIRQGIRLLSEAIKHVAARL